MQKSNKLLFSREFVLEKISKNLNFLLKETGITAKHLAAKTGINNSLISKYKTGGALAPIDNLLTICTYFEVDIKAFTTEDLTASKNMLNEPSESYNLKSELEKISLKSRIKDLEMALIRHVDKPEVIQKYIDDA